MTTIAETASLNNHRINEPNSSTLFVGQSVVIVHLRCKVVPLGSEVLAAVLLRCNATYSLISGFTDLCWALAHFIFQFRNPVHSQQNSFDGDQPVARPLPTRRINAHRHPCVEWDSNPRSQRSSWRREFMP
jgi:hypothetical protein